MSIIQAMLAGSSALSNYGEAMTVIGNNLANANTTAFKGSRTTFEDVLIQTVGVSGTRSSTQIGTGVGLAGVDQNMNQGSFSSTNSVIDMAIDGRGYFMVKDPGTDASDVLLPPTSSDEDTFYTRAGDFQQTKSGMLVANNGLVLQGWKMAVDGTLESTTIANVDLSEFETAPPQASTLVDVGLSLSADAQVITDSLHSTYNPNDASSFNHSTTVRVYDSLGKGHNVDLHFKKLADKPAQVADGGTLGTIDFALTDDASTTFTFTDSTGTTVTADAVSFSAGNNAAFDLSTLTVGGAALALTSGTSYDIGYTVSTGAMAGISGTDSVGEVPRNTWEWHTAVDTDELIAGHKGTGNLTAVDTTTGNVRAVNTTGATAGYQVGRLSFDEQGRLKQEGSTPITFNFYDTATASTAEAQEILFDFGGAIGVNGDSTNDYSKQSTDLVYNTASSAVTAELTSNTGRDKTVQFAGEFATRELSQNGYSSGFLDNLQVGQDGVVFGTYTNGTSRPMYKIALVDFSNESGLEQIGANLFGKTNISGEPLIGVPQSGRLGSIVNFTLEQSNVDMSNEFVNMISTQRAFQANSRIVSVADGMLEELISLKR